MVRPVRSLQSPGLRDPLVVQAVQGSAPTACVRHSSSDRYHNQCLELRISLVCTTAAVLASTGMKKVVIHRAGGYQELQLESHPEIAPRTGEVRIAVRAIGVNYADCVVRMGLYESARKYVGWPITPGFEFAGVVDAVGDGVLDLSPGQRVFGLTRFGAYATSVVVPRDRVFAVPTDLSFEQAAGFSVVYLTAWYGLLHLAHPRAGDKILVHSAAGGVGSALLQLCRASGLDAVGVVGSRAKIQYALECGARAVIDKSSEDLWHAAETHAPRGYRVVLDANGAETLRESYEHLASPGALVVYGFHSMLPRTGGVPNLWKLALQWLRTPRFDPLRLTGENRSVMGFNLSYLFEEQKVMQEGMGLLLDLLQARRIAAPRIETFAFNDVANAHRALESGRTIGKLVLVVE